MLLLFIFHIFILFFLFIFFSLHFIIFLVLMVNFTKEISSAWGRGQEPSQETGGNDGWQLSFSILSS